LHKIGPQFLFSTFYQTGCDIICVGYSLSHFSVGGTTFFRELVEKESSKETLDFHLGLMSIPKVSECFG